MKLFIISDTHFGVHGCSNEWLQIQLESMDWFINQVKKTCSDGDRVLHLGDVYDSRQSIHMKALHAAPMKFKELAKILPIDIILGNHDCHDKNTNDVNSVEPTMGLIDNVTIMKEPDVREYGGRVFGFMPWRYGEENQRTSIEREVIADFISKGVEVMFCHTDMKGINLNSFRINESGCTSADFDKFKHVFSGHIHHRQTSKNVTFVGSPYSMSRTDVGNSKGYWVLDTENLSFEFFENPVCPKFLKLYMDDLLDKKLCDVEEMIANNFVDVVVDFHNNPDFPYQEFVRLLDGKSRRLIPIGSERKVDSNDIKDMKVDLEATMDVIQLGCLYIDGLKYEEKIKNRLKESIKELHQRVTTHKG